MVAIWEMETPSATSKIIRPRRARPAETVVARCQASSVWRWVGVRQMVREVVRPRAIERPSVRSGRWLQNTCEDSNRIYTLFHLWSNEPSSRASQIHNSHTYTVCLDD